MADCIFCKLIKGEVPAQFVYQNDHVVAFNDINPQAPTHVLIIPKGKYVSFADFSAKADDAEVLGFVRAVGHVARLLGLEDQGYRLLANMGPNSHQEVPHFHVHLFAGRPLGPMLIGT